MNFPSLRFRFCVSDIVETKIVVYENFYFVQICQRNKRVDVYFSINEDLFEVKCRTFYFEKAFYGYEKEKSAGSRFRNRNLLT